MGRPRRISAALLGLALLAGACSSDDAGDDAGGGGGEAQAAAGQETESTTSGPPYRVDTQSETFVDDSRPTEDPSGQLSAPTRTLRTELYVPDGAGPFPLVVIAHGFDGHPRKFTQLASVWAEAGYVVAVPAFPLTNDRAGGPTVLGDYVNQPADVSFVIDSVLRLLGGTVDGDHIGVAGHSLGGATTYGLVFNDCCRDDRVDAVVLMSTLRLPFADGRYDLGDVPKLLLQLTEDPIVPYQQAVDTFDEAAAPKFLVTLEGGGHFEPYENAPSPHDEVVEATTAAFWDAYLRADGGDGGDGGADGGVDRLVEAAESNGDTRIAADP
jgi:dienelactone hydrolase